MSISERIPIPKERMGGTKCSTDMMVELNPQQGLYEIPGETSTGDQPGQCGHQPFCRP